MLKKSIKTKVNMNLSSVTQGCYPISSFWAVLSKKKKKMHTQRGCTDAMFEFFMDSVYVIFESHGGYK